MLTPSIRPFLLTTLSIVTLWPLTMRAQANIRSTDTLPVNVVQRGMDAYNRRDVDAMAALYDTVVVHESLVDSTGPQRMSRAAVRDGILKSFQQARNSKLTLVKRIATGPFVVDVYDLAMDGKRSRHLDLFEVRKGKIVREWEN